MPINMNADEYLQLKQNLITQAKTINDGEALAFLGFTLFRRNTRVGIAISTADVLINIHNIHPGQSYLLEGDAAVPNAHGNYLSLTIDINEVNLNVPIKADDFANRMLSFADSNIRNELVANPWSWAEKVIEMSGDKTTNKHPYPYIAELYLTHALRSAGLLIDVEREYRGPDGSSHDFELAAMSFEAKSHLHAAGEGGDGELVISSENQLARTAGKPLYVVYFKMEETGPLTLESYVALFPNERQSILEKIRKSGGFVEGDFSWQRPYHLQSEPRVYRIDDTFPKITPTQFKGDVFPSGVTTLRYHVSLHNRPYCPLNYFLSAIQNDMEPVFSTGNA